MPERTKRSRYPAHRAQVINARHYARQAAGDWGADSTTADTVVSVVGELVANAVTHARVPKGRQVGLTLHFLDSVIRVEVRDADATPPAGPAAPGEGDSLVHEESGRGLLLVRCLCERWGVEREVVGKTVWAEIVLASGEGEDHSGTVR
jgi:anti-sigma regulatory factor (Ser/Thr protein kinase)